MSQETTPEKLGNKPAHPKNYWMKLREDAYFEGTPYYYLLKQKNGAEYIIIYQKMCLMSLNSNGVLVKNYGDIISAIDKDDIFNALFGQIKRNVIDNGIDIFIKLHLIRINDNGYYQINNYESLTGYESSSPAAKRKRKERETKKETAESDSLYPKPCDPSQLQSPPISFESIVSKITG